jgi:putative PIN family toxin of toxin-antitoxin system
MLIFDTNIWISYALTPKGTVGGCVHKALQNYDCAFSEETFREVTEVLLRPKFDPYISSERRVSFLEKMASVARWFVVTDKVTDCRDPKDNIFLELALACNADYLVTGDRDLLVLDPYGKTRILTVATFTELLV